MLVHILLQQRPPQGFICSTATFQKKILKCINFISTLLRTSLANPQESNKSCWLAVASTSSQHLRQLPSILGKPFARIYQYRIIVIVRRELKGQCITIISSLLSATAGSPQATYQGRAKLKSLSPKFSDLRSSQTALFTNWSVPQRNISPQSKLNRNCNILNIRTPHPHTIFRLEFCRNLPCFFWGFKQV